MAPTPKGAVTFGGWLVQQGVMSENQLMMHAAAHSSALSKRADHAVRTKVLPQGFDLTPASLDAYLAKKYPKYFLPYQSYLRLIGASKPFTTGE